MHNIFQQPGIQVFLFQNLFEPPLGVDFVVTLPIIFSIITYRNAPKAYGNLRVLWAPTVFFLFQKKKKK